MKTHITTIKQGLAFTIPALLLAMGPVASAAITFAAGTTRDFEGGTNGDDTNVFGGAVFDLHSEDSVIDTSGTAQSEYDIDNTGGAVTTTQTKGALLTRNTGGANGQMGSTFSDEPNTSTTYFMQFDFKNTVSLVNSGVFFQGGSGRAINIHFGTSIQANQGSGFTDLTGGTGGFGTPSSGADIVALDEWYRMTLTINPLSAADDTFDLRLQSLGAGADYVDTTWAGIGFQDDTDDLNSFRFHFNTGSSVNGEYAIDNVRFTTTSGNLFFESLTPVPEPSSTALIGLGGLALILRRRRLA